MQYRGGMVWWTTERKLLNYLNIYCKGFHYKSAKIICRPRIQATLHMIVQLDKIFQQQIFHDRVSFNS